MQQPMCPRCGTAIQAADVNVAADVAFCRKCNAGQNLSLLISGSLPDPQVDPLRPPPGCWYRPGAHGAVVGASHRSLGTAAAILFFALFWNGIVGLFVLLATAATLRLMEVPVPEWFPAPDSNKKPMQKGMVVFLWVFLAPFLLIGAGLIISFFHSLFGKTELTVDRGSARVGSGIGPLFRGKTFATADFSLLRIEDHVRPRRAGQSFGRHRIVAELGDGRSVPFGQGLPGERIRFLASTADKLLRGSLP